MHHADGVRWDVMKHFYDRCSRSDPGSAEVDAAEAGLSLALERDFHTTDFPLALHDVLRNAKHNSARSRRRRHELVQRACAYRPDGLSTDSPESIAIARETLRELRHALEPHGRRAHSCLDAMLVGEPPAETAARTGIPIRSVHRLRKLVRTCLGEVLASAA